MENKIEHPKVFISYSWSGKEYEDRVMDLAIKLQQDGIEVVIDKWSMQPGNDTRNFMEKCVKDSTIHFVLMLIDKAYTEKADKRNGGVGIETQIISSEVYNNVEQSKFIPIVFDRDEDGETHIPIYLKSRFHYDLTGDSKDEEYIKLVKQIYGRPIYFKPQLGNKPKWVDDSLNSPSALKLKAIQNSQNGNNLDFLIDEIKKSDIGENANTEGDEIAKSNQILEIYNKSVEYRNALIEIFLYTYKEKEFVDDICDFYENIKNWNNQNHGLKKEIWDAFIHETFIYLISVLFKNKQYKTINIFLEKSYFQEGYGESITTVNNYFYSSYYDILKEAKCKVDEQNYFNGVAQIWIENIYEPKVTKGEFIHADLLIYNLTVLLTEQDWYWFPITYVYGRNSRFDGAFKNFSVKLKSKYQINRFKDLFNINNVEDLKILIDKMSRSMMNRQERYRYGGAFEYADLIIDYIKPNEIGSAN